MTNKNWLNLVEQNEEKIIKKGIEIYKMALDNTFLRYVLCLDEDGDLSILTDVAGGNNMLLSVFKGEAINLFEFCFQYNEIEIAENDLVTKLEEKGFSDKIEKLKKEAKEEYSSIELIINRNYSDLKFIVVECLEEAKAFDVENYARDIVKEKFENVKENLKMLGDE